MVATTEQKGRGAYFTPTPVAEFITSWAIRSPKDRVLEPSCGDAQFLIAAGKRISDLGTPATSGQLLGTEIHEPSASTARERLGAAGTEATIEVGDFFDRFATPTLDVVIGNPPYIRYQDFSGSAREKGQRAAKEGGVVLPGLASSWAAFVVHAARFLRPGGRLGLVLPAELLSVNYAGPVREFLLNRFASVTLVLFDELIFPGAQADVALLLAEGDGSCDKIRIAHARNSATLRDIDVDTDSIVWSPELFGAKWTGGLADPVALGLIAELVEGGAFAALGTEWGTTNLGAVTGNNSYFALPAARARALELGDRDTIRISPPGSKHLRGLTFSDTAFSEMEVEGARTRLFYPQGSEPTGPAQRYIEQGEAEGVHLAYKCRTRRPWWRVPLSARPDLLLTYMNHGIPRLTENQANVDFLNSVHGVSLRPERRELGRRLLPLATLNSITALSAEVTGRSYGGGILKLEPSEASRWLVPSYEGLSTVDSKLRAVRPQLAPVLRVGKHEDAIKRIDDAFLVRGLGLSRAAVRDIRAARLALQSRRRERPASAVAS